MQGMTDIGAETPQPLTEKPHDLILASRVEGTAVFNRADERIGHVSNLSIHKESGQTLYAIISVGGFLGLGERLHPIPWGMLTYNLDKGGYVISADKETLKNAPTLSPEEMEDLGAGAEWRERLNDYYSAYGYPPLM